MSQVEQISIILNPTSGKGGKRHAKSLALRHARRRAQQLRIPLRLLKTQRAGHATALAQESGIDEKGRVLAIGGDGTVNETAQGLINSPSTLGIIPMGSGNGLARHLHLPMNPQRAVETAITGASIPMDYGTIGEHSFFTTAGIGLDAEVGWAFAELDGRGLRNYVRATAALYFRYKPKDYEIRVDGKVISRRALMITFANANQFGNNARIAPAARVDDGFLELVIVRPFPKAMIGILAGKLLRGTINRSPYIETIHFHHAEIYAPGGAKGHVDGEPVSLPERFTVQVHPHALRVVAGENAKECKDLNTSCSSAEGKKHA